MKYKLKNVKTIKRTLTLLCVCAGVALTLGASAYVKLNQQIERNEKSSQLIITLTQTARMHILLHELDKDASSDKPDAARKFLNRELASNVAIIKTLAPATDERGQRAANMVLEQVAKNEKQSPAKYLVASQHAHL